MRATEHNTKTPSAKAGFFAALTAFLRLPGRAAPAAVPALRPAAPRPFAVLLATAAMAGLATVGASAAVPASASAQTPAQERCEAAQKENGNVTELASAPTVKKRTLTSVTLRDTINDYGCETHYRLEWSTAPGGPWSPFPGGEGTVPGVAEVKIDPPFETEFETGELTGLEPETTYYDRAVLENALGVKKQSGSGPSNEQTPFTFKAKSLSPGQVGTGATSVGETSARLEANITPSPFETHWRIEYAPAEENGQLPAEDSPAWARVGEGTISQVEAEALQTPVGAEVFHPEEVDLTGLSPTSRYYARVVAEDEPEWPPSSGEMHHLQSTSLVYGGALFVTSGPPVAEAFDTAALRLETIRLLGYVVPHGFDTHYRFEYGPTIAYGSQTPEEDTGTGGFGQTGESATTTAAADLPGLQPGQTYHYRITATSAAGGGITVYGADHTLTVPSPAEAGPEAPCPNQATRTGPSSRLPDCRAYEQLTPVDKGGAEEFFNSLEAGVVVGEDGDHVMLSSPFTKWGSGQSPYFFSRTPTGWVTTAGTAQPEAGIDKYEPELFNPDLTSFAFGDQWGTSGQAMSPDIAFRVGSPGGPYATAASVPRHLLAQFGQSQSAGWVAASADFSKLILRAEDHALVPGHPSTTTSGSDLYEYSAGELRQLNITTGGATIGSCGATMAVGHAERLTSGSTSSPHAVSGDGSRVFFEAVPGPDCAGSAHLYMRTDGAETLDLGPVTFLAANAAGTEVLLESQSGGAQQVLLYDTASATSKVLFTLHEHLSGKAHLKDIYMSEDFSTIYLSSSEALTPEAPPPGLNQEDIYRYDVASEALHFVVEAHSIGNPEVTPDGRYLYWRGTVVGLPLGDDLEKNPVSHEEDAILYDSVHNLVECVSCASPFNPEPKLSISPSYLGTSSIAPTRDGTPQLNLISADGSRVFFDTPSALLPSDIDGEESSKTDQEELTPSSDVYEWRRNGLEGCVHVQGCLALITSGRGGGFVLLLGADPSGRDVFFSTHEPLLPQDNDTALDIYDARSGGGFPPPPPRPVECEGDACATPFAPPSEQTPSSFTFQGAGNLLTSALPAEVKPAAKPKPKKTKPKKRTKKKPGKRAKQGRRQAEVKR